MLIWEALAFERNHVAHKYSIICLMRMTCVGQLQSIKDNDQPFVAPGDMLRELMADNEAVIQAMRQAHSIADDNNDVATASVLEVFIDGAEKRNWFLFEASRKADGSGH